MVASSIRYFRTLSKNTLIKNSSWGIVSQIVQAIFMSLFFVIVARHYSVNEFATYVIATALYQLMTVLSTLGLSQWFIRELATSNNKIGTTNAFFKLQFILGVFFFILNITVANLLYDDQMILHLSILFGANIILDNIINVIKCLNIAEYKQKKTFQIVIIETLMKFFISCFLFIISFSLIQLSIFLILIRLLSLNLFFKLGTSSLINFNAILHYNISLTEVRKLIFNNWPFIIIGGVSMINWRIANIIISKSLTETDIANYEISYKLFSIAQIIPVVISATVFPKLVSFSNESLVNALRMFYRKMFVLYFGLGLLFFVGVAVTAPTLIPFFFGDNYNETHVYAIQMFFTILIFPTAYLQANLLVAMGREKTDMWLNVISLVVNLSISLIGLYFYKSLTVINISIFISFIVFHLLQDSLLIKRKVAGIKQVVLFYSIILLVISMTYFLY